MTILGGIGFISDAIGLSLQLNIDYWWILLAGFVGGILVSHKDLRNLYILVKAHQHKGNAAFIGKHEVCEEDSSNGNIHIYKVSGNCIYPDCTGKVILEHTPPRELKRLSNSYVGICSVCGKDHSYKVDFNLVATPEKFDWRPKEKGPVINFV